MSSLVSFESYSPDPPPRRSSWGLARRKEDGDGDGDNDDELPWTSTRRRQGLVIVGDAWNSLLMSSRIEVENFVLLLAPSSTTWKRQPASCEESNAHVLHDHEDRVHDQVGNPD